MQTAPFQPRLTKAECEFWFEAGADWQEQTEERIGASLAQAFLGAADVTEPFLWFEPNYLAVLTEPAGSVKAYLDVKTHAGRIRRALAAYDDAVQPRRVETLFLNYQFELPAAILRDSPKELVWKTPRERMTLEREFLDSGQARLHLRCLITHPPARCLTRSKSWLERIHQKMDSAFHYLRQGHPLAEGRRR